MPYPIFDRSCLRLKPLAERVHDLSLAQFANLDDPPPSYDHPDLAELAGGWWPPRAPGAPSSG